MYVLQVQTGQYWTGQHSTARVSEEENRLESTAPRTSNIRIESGGSLSWRC